MTFSGLVWFDVFSAVFRPNGEKLAKQAEAVEPRRTVPVPVGPPSDSLYSGRILTMDDVFERYTEADVVRIVRWYEGVRTTIPELPRRSDE